MLNNILSILPLIIPGLCFLLIAIFYAIVLKRKLLETFFLSSATIIFVLFLSGLLNFRGCLLFGYTVIISFSLFSFFYFIRAYIRNRNIIKEISLIHGFLVIGGLLAFSLFLNYGRMLSIWDELTHWGSAIKNMYFLDALGTFKESSGHVGSYPPAASLFQYFWIRPFSKFVEFPSYIASNIIFFSLILTFLKKFNLRNILFLVTSFLIPFFILPTFFTSIYVDNIIGILFGCILLAYFTLDKEGYSLYRLLLISSIVVVLTLTKDIGLVFSGIACLIIIFDMFVIQRKFTTEDINKQKSSIKKVVHTILLLSPIIITLAVRLIWTLHLNITNAFPNSKTGGEGIYAFITHLIDNDVLPYQYQTIVNFKEAFFSEPLLPLELSAFKLFIILIFITVLALLFIIKKTPISKLRLLLAILESLLGGIFYIGFLLLLYISIFSPYEAEILASYSRYILSYMLGIFFFFMIFILEEFKLTTKNTKVYKNFVYNLKLIILTLLIFAFYYCLVSRTKENFNINILQARTSVEKTISIRRQYDKILIWKKYLSDKSYQPYIISQGDRGFDYIVIIHTLYPTHIEWKWDYSVGLEPYYPELNDPWTRIFTSEEWGKYVIQNYERLYVFKYDDKFNQIYGHYFDNLENNAFYEVTTDEKGTLELKSLPLP